ncbi:MAG: hypothetical protein JF619_03865 [Massilia sp.]|nr:hypothetical protein [Massilia sp.]
MMKAIISTGHDLGGAKLLAATTDKTPNLKRLFSAVARGPELARRIDEGILFNPWHALAGHRPLGSIMRVRKAVYAMSKRFRAERNGIEIAEPRDVTNLIYVSSFSHSKGLPLART